MDPKVIINIECGSSHKTQTTKISIIQSVIKLNIPQNLYIC